MKQKSETVRANLTDEEIVELYWERNEKAIEATDRKYRKYLYVIAYNIVHNQLDSEECLNDTYLGTWNRIPPAKPTVFQSFLTKIMRNIAVDKYRENNAAKRVPSELTVSLNELNECIAYDGSDDAEAAVSAISDLLNNYLRGLSAREEFIFICRYYYGDRVPTIAAMLKLSESTIFRDLSRIRDGLKEQMKKEGYRL